MPSITKNSDQTKNHRGRVRNKYSKLLSFDSYEPYEVLELLLFHAIPRKDTKPIAKDLINTFGSLKGVLEADINSLMKRPGVGPSTALYLTMFSRVNSYISQEHGQKIKGATDLGAYAMQLTKGKKTEEVYVIGLNPAHEIIHHRRLSVGNFSSVSVNFRDIITFAIETNSAALALVHNHTNGILIPSSDDKRTTEDVMKIANSLGIKLIDHIITTQDGYLSMASMNIPDFRGNLL